MPFWKRKNPDKIKRSQKICPKCLKPTLVKTLKYSGWMSTPWFSCHDCGYSGGFYLEVDPEEDGKEFIDLEELKKKFPEFIENENSE